ncbi:hypothetical protein GCM10008956_33400 [Deinococcus arenae]|uniref:DUF11 domain-containing protein n=1 Tax=Deinococcus arenae TaxID=1452751 RepID=A0A8H9GSC9_9DEIO|nr:DUF11 domain-containing protein [Deinococcus arenae]AWT34259.1 hypothetical protein DM785_00855 [Deinococcus actinosclerus]GGM54818.1 hypothetical protein GCM10008956_33400 [Deinococcus arenae]
MNRSLTLTALIALAAGSAHAAGTAAGTVITNTAEIVFTPEGGTTPTKVPSNDVTTTVLPVPSFTITPNDEGAAGPTFPTQNATLQRTLVPGSTAVFLYTLTNTGNVPNESYALTSLTSGAAGAPAPSDVRYYPKAADTNTDNTLDAAEIAAATPITTIGGVNQDQKKDFFQVYTVPATATNGQQLGADPVGTRLPNSGAGLEPAAPYTQPTDNDNYNTVTVDRKDATLIGPKDDADGNGTPTTPPYTSSEGVIITPSASDTQTAQATATTTAVTFTNTVQNTGNRPDVFDITAALTGFPSGATVTLLKPDATPLTDTDGDSVPDVGSLAPGQTANVLVRVTFPAGGLPSGTPTATVTSTSSNDPTKKDDTRDLVNLPGLSFGNPTPTPGGDPTIPGTPEAGTPGSPTSPIIPPSTCTTASPTIRSTVALEIANLGSAPDTFDVSGTATIKITTGPDVIAPVRYFVDTNGNKALDSGEPALTDTNGNGTADTGPLAPGAELKLIAAVDVPCAAAAQTITLKQTAKSPTTGVEVKDTNDTILVGKTDVAKPTKTVDKATAKPGDTLTYTIIGKNTSNANVTKAFIKDALPVNTSFVSFSATSTATGTILYSTNGSDWSAAAITALPDGGTVYAGVDTNNNGTIDTGDLLAPGQTITGTFKVTVK